MTYQELVDALFDRSMICHKQESGIGNYYSDGKCMVKVPAPVTFKPPVGCRTVSIIPNTGVMDRFNHDEPTPLPFVTDEPIIHGECPRCKGGGTEPATVECSDCDGTGTTECCECGQDVECSTCDGSGRVKSKTETATCSQCEGRGVVPPAAVRVGKATMMTRYFLLLSQLSDAHYDYDEARILYHVSANGGECHAWIMSRREGADA